MPPPVNPALYYPDLSDVPQNVQNAMKRAYDNIYALRAAIAQIVVAHNQVAQQVNGLSTAGQKQQTQIVLTDAL